MKMPQFNLTRSLNCALLVFGLLFGSAAITVAQDAKAPIAAAKDLKWLSSELRAPKQHDGLTTAEPTDVERFESLLVKTLRVSNAGDPDESLADLSGKWAQLHWKLVMSPSEEFFVVRENLNHRNGRGIYAFRTRAALPVVLQAPHRFSDLMTGSIALKLFYEQSVSAIGLNSIHRKEIDLSHTKLHYINAFTSAVIKAHQETAIVQIHGFTKQGKTGAAKFTKVIVSDTTNFPGRSARQTALELKTTFGADHTRLFPVDVRQLGGTTNQQSKIAHSLGCPNFLHIELNHEFRSQLKLNASVRDAFFASVLRGTSELRSSQ